MVKDHIGQIASCSKCGKKNISAHDSI